MQTQEQHIFLGGAFIYSENVKELANWYQTHLHLPIEYNEEYKCAYGTLSYLMDNQAHTKAQIVLSILPMKEKATKKPKQFMINYRVSDLKSFVEELKQNNIAVKGIEDYPGQGLFAWIFDPDGNEIELWQDTNLK